ncbi:MAG: HEPN domain-containing protein [Deferrisomatales bacterium]
MRDLEHARQLLDMARKDLAALRAMGDREAFAEEVFGFHAEQAAEKALKAWAAGLGCKYPFRHDLGELLSLLEGEGEEVGPFWGVVAYTDFGVRFRYEALGEEETPLDRQVGCAEVAALVEHVAKLLEQAAGSS